MSISRFCKLWREGRLSPSYVESLDQGYDAVVAANKLLKQDSARLERELDKANERIEALEQELVEAQERLERLAMDLGVAHQREVDRLRNTLELQDRILDKQADKLCRIRTIARGEGPSP